MSTDALIMMIVAIVVLWGAFAASLVHLSRHPDETVSDES